MRYDENPFTCQCKKEEENAEGFQILHFYWSFLSDIIAVKGLRAATLHVHPCVWVWLALFWCGISLIRFSHTSGTQYVIKHKQRQVMGTSFFSPSEQMSALSSIQTWFQLLGTFAYGGCSCCSCRWSDVSNFFRSTPVWSQTVLFCYINTQLLELKLVPSTLWGMFTRRWCQTMELVGYSTLQTEAYRSPPTWREFTKSVLEAKLLIEFALTGNFWYFTG